MGSHFGMSFSLEAVRTLEEQGFSQLKEAFFLNGSRQHRRKPGVSKNSIFCEGIYYLLNCNLLNDIKCRLIASFYIKF